MQAMGDRSETNSFVVRPFIYLRSSLKLTWVGKDNLGPEEAHQLPPLDAEGFRHYDDEWISTRGADHGQSDASVPRGGLDHRLAGLEMSLLLGPLDDP